MNKTQRSHVIDQLRELQAQRIATIKTIGRIENQRRALMARSFGYDPTLPSPARTKIMKTVEAFITGVLKNDEDAKLLKPEMADAVFVYQESITPIEAHKKELEKRQNKLVVTLPDMQDFVDSVKGFGVNSLAVIIGECGDLANYSSPAKVWKRMGLAVINGESQRKCTDKTKALLHGYNPQRRARMFVVGECLIKVRGLYKTIYDDRKKTEHAKTLAEGLVPATTIKDTVDVWEENLGLELTKVKKIETGVHRSAGHMSKRAHRYMEKKLLEHLWMVFHPVDVKKAA